MIDNISKYCVLREQMVFIIDASTRSAQYCVEFAPYISLYSNQRKT